LLAHVSEAHALLLGRVLSELDQIHARRRAQRRESAPEFAFQESRASSPREQTPHHPQHQLHGPQAGVERKLRLAGARTCSELHLRALAVYGIKSDLFGVLRAFVPCARVHSAAACVAPVLGLDSQRPHPRGLVLVLQAHRLHDSTTSSGPNQSFLELESCLHAGLGKEKHPLAVN
jgi:hypothetical protein